jgi:hypothetical protein
MAAKAWRRCLKPDDAAVFSLAENGQAAWAVKLWWDSWAMRNKAGGPSLARGIDNRKHLGELSNCRLIWRFACARLGKVFDSKFDTYFQLSSLSR